MTLPPVPRRTRPSSVRSSGRCSPRARSHCRFVPSLIRFIPDFLRESGALWLKDNATGPGVHHEFLRRPLARAALRGRIRPH